jgi:hypothetical protein
LVQAIALGATDPRYNRDTSLQFIPNMDGFPNGRRLEDDVTRIELQAVSGIVLAALGLYYDDYQLGSNDPITQRTIAVYNYNTGINRNDTTFMRSFPFVQAPYPGNGPRTCVECIDNNQGASTPSTMTPTTTKQTEKLSLAAPDLMIATQSPVIDVNTIRYHIATPSRVQIVVYDVAGHPLKVLVDRYHEAGTYSVRWNTTGLNKGSYLIAAKKDGQAAKTVQVIKD